LLEAAVGVGGGGLAPAEAEVVRLDMLSWSADAAASASPRCWRCWWNIQPCTALIFACLGIYLTLATSPSVSLST
jgi:hypothetical protein